MSSRIPQIEEIARPSSTPSLASVTDTLEAVSGSSVPTVEELRKIAIDYIYKDLDIKTLQEQTKPVPSTYQVDKSNIDSVFAALQGGTPLKGSVTDYPIVSTWGTQQQKAYEASLNPDIEALKKQIAELTAKVGVGNEENNPDIGLLKGQIAFYENLLKEYKGDYTKATAEFSKYKSDTALLRDILLGVVGYAGGQAILPIITGAASGITWGYGAAEQAMGMPKSAYTLGARYYDAQRYLSSGVRYYFNKYLGRWLPSKFQNGAYRYSNSGKGQTRIGDLRGDAEEGYYLANEGGKSYSYLKGITSKKVKTYLKKGSQVLWTAYAAQQLGRTAYNTANAYTGFNQGAYMDSRGATYQRMYWSWKYQKYLPSKY